MTTEFAICLNELSNYNNGELVYKWFNLDNYVDASEFWEAVSTMKPMAEMNTSTAWEPAKVSFSGLTN